MDSENLTIFQPTVVNRPSIRFFRVNHSLSLIIDVTATLRRV